MKDFDIRDEKGFPKICENCICKDVCYYLNEYGECTHCNYFAENSYSNKIHKETEGEG